MSFNPSFTGIALVANARHHADVDLQKFQSFFYWNCLGGEHHVPAQADPQQSFNPSFTGIALVALVFLLAIFGVHTSFNPSFTGIALVAKNVSGGHVQHVDVSILLLLELPWWRCRFNVITGWRIGFQSFFYWNCLGGLSCGAPTAQAGSSFNPSFTGIALVAFALLPAKIIIYKFQSFFYWNCLGGFCCM